MTVRAVTDRDRLVLTFAYLGAYTIVARSDATE